MHFHRQTQPATRRICEGLLRGFEGKLFQFQLLNYLLQFVRAGQDFAQVVSGQRHLLYQGFGEFGIASDKKQLTVQIMDDFAKRILFEGFVQLRSEFCRLTQ